MSKTATATVTKKAKAIDLLVNKGMALTEGELAARLNTSGDAVRSIISQVRRAGYAVYKNAGTKDARGRTRAARYRVGAPTKAMVAAYYTVFGA
jgi:predicted ArsR family transcriptional regulator